MLLSLVLGVPAADSQWIVEPYALFLAALILVGGVMYFLPFLLIQVHGHRSRQLVLPTWGRARPRLRSVLDLLQGRKCSHIEEIRDVEASAQGCEDCMKSGDSWVHLRMCLICGHVGCCDQSPNRHATRHFHATGHPVIRSFEPGEDWRWCYVDEALV